MKSKIIACAQQKGGVGKTSSCANLSVALAMAGYKVLNVDCDSLCRYRHKLSYPEDKVIPNFLE